MVSPNQSGDCRSKLCKLLYPQYAEYSSTGKIRNQNKGLEYALRVPCFGTIKLDGFTSQLLVILSELVFSPLPICLPNKVTDQQDFNNN